MFECFLIQDAKKSVGFYFPQRAKFTDDDAWNGFRSGNKLRELNSAASQVRSKATLLKAPGSPTICGFPPKLRMEPEYQECIDFIMKHPDYETLGRPNHAWLYSLEGGKPVQIALKARTQPS